jgi:hypothetical protein
MVVVEFLGMIRQRAGRAGLLVGAGPVSAILDQICFECPQLKSSLDDLAVGACLISLNGERFVADRSEPIPPGSHLIILGADAGG